MEEPCGWPHLDFRNLLNVPRERSAAFAQSDAVALLFAAEALVRVEATGSPYTSIFEVVWPCCAKGGECCPGDDVHRKDCCSEGLVLAWAKRNNVQPAARLGWKTGRKWFDKWHYRLGQRQRQSQHMQLPQVTLLGPPQWAAVGCGANIN